MRRSDLRVESEPGLRIAVRSTFFSLDEAIVWGQPWHPVPFLSSRWRG